MDPLVLHVARSHGLARRVARRFTAEADLWKLAQEDLRVFNQRYEEIHRLYQADNTEAIDKLLNDFAFRKNGTAPSFIGSDFYKWMSAAFRPGDIDDPDALRPPGVLIMGIIDGETDISEFFILLDAYRDALQAVVDATAPAKFNYQGFAVENAQHLGDALSRRVLEGVDYVVAIFKKRGLDKLLTNEIRSIELAPKFEKALGYYYPSSKSIALSAAAVGLGTGRFMKWVNEVFLHEFGHHVHMSYITGEARAVWDDAWTEVQEKKEVIERAFKSITQAERKRYFDTLMATGWDPSRTAKKLGAVDRVKFGVWLRTPMFGDAIITDKQFRLTKSGLYMASFFQDTKAFMEKNRGVTDETPDEDVKKEVAQVAKKMWERLGLDYSGAYPIPPAVVEEMSKADPAMQKTVDEALEKLQVVSDYGKTNEKEDFAETFVAFVGAPEKLTPTAKFRMQRALSISGLYGKPVMRLAHRVAWRFKAANVVPFKPKKPSGPTLPIGGRKYALSDYFPFLSDMVGDEEKPGGARLIVNEPRFSYLWAYDTDKKFVAMWRVSDGDEKAGGSASHYTSEVIALERKGQLNRVTHEEFRAIERYMADQQRDTMASLKKYLAEHADDWDREAKEIAQELFDEKFLPRILAKFREVEQGVKPLGFKVKDFMLEHRSAEDQAKMFVSQPIMNDYTLKAVDDFARKKGADPDNPPGDIQALQWAHGDVIHEFYEHYFK